MDRSLFYDIGQSGFDLYFYARAGCLTRYNLVMDCDLIKINICQKLRYFPNVCANIIARRQCRNDEGSSRSPDVHTTSMKGKVC